MIINRGVIVEREENYTLNYYDANAGAVALTFTRIL